MDPDRLAPALFKKIWERIFRPTSGSPDVEVGHVLRVMVDVLVETDMLPDCGSPEANWALAYVTITGGSHPGDICAGWSDKVPYYSDERDKDGYRKSRPFEEYGKDLQAADKAMAKALQEMQAKGLLVRVDDKLQRPMPEKAQAEFKKLHYYVLELSAEDLAHTGSEEPDE